MQIPIGSRVPLAAAILLIVTCLTLLPVWMGDPETRFGLRESQLPSTWALSALWPGLWSTLAPTTAWLVARIVLFLVAAVYLCIAMKKTTLLRTSVVLVGVAVTASFLMGLTGNSLVSPFTGFPTIAAGALAGISLIVLATSRRTRAAQRAWRIMVYVTSGALFILMAITTMTSYWRHPFYYSWWNPKLYEFYSHNYLHLYGGDPFQNPMDTVVAMVPVCLVIATLVTLALALTSKQGPSHVHPLYATATMPDGSRLTVPVAEVYRQETLPTGVGQMVPVTPVPTPTPNVAPLRLGGNLSV